MAEIQMWMNRYGGPYWSAGAGMYSKEYNDLIADFRSGGYWDYKAVDSYWDYKAGHGVIKMKRIWIATGAYIQTQGGYDQTDLHEFSQLARKTAGGLLATSLPLQQAFERASLYPGKPSAWATTLVKLEKSILGKKIISQPLFTMNAVNAGKWATGLKIASKTIGVGGVLLAGYDIKQNGLTTSNTLDLVMSGCTYP